MHWRDTSTIALGSIGGIDQDCAPLQNNQLILAA